jgi:hypothetical protein
MGLGACQRERRYVVAGLQTVSAGSTFSTLALVWWGI